MLARLAQWGMLFPYLRFAVCKTLTWVMLLEKHTWQAQTCSTRTSLWLKYIFIAVTMICHSILTQLCKIQNNVAIQVASRCLASPQHLPEQQHTVIAWGISALLVRSSSTNKVCMLPLFTYWSRSGSLLTLIISGVCILQKRHADCIAV